MKTTFFQKFARKDLFTLCLLLLSQAVRAQGSAGALKNIGTWVSTLGNAVFAIVVVIGLVRTVTKFIKGEPDAIGALFQLIIACGLWGGFQLVEDDIAKLVGGKGR
ncbi:hypothetical protein AAG747_28315 [Rapidithrix thailandica]|uniref:Uncharacterized protein n=1 Tax=Rapidithrix thailandica TaxID=413964 RepID=A0AAW9SHU6_9BACT